MIKSTKYLFFILLAIVLSNCSKQQTTFDLIIENAVIFDGVTYQEVPKCILIRNNKISKIISQSEFNPAEYSIINLIDAKGNFVMPGIIEGHGHLLNYGEGLTQLNLGQYDNWEEIIQAVEEKAQETPEGTWIEGRGWHQEKWNEVEPNSVQGYPHHEELSRRVPNHPVYLRHASGHAAFANKRAMDLVGISIETKSPSGGRILRDANGRLAGIFEENSEEIISDYVRKTKNLTAIWEASLLLSSQSCLENGITSFQDAGSSVDQIKWFREKANNNELPLRFYLMAYDSLQKLNKNYPEIRLINEGDSFLTCRSIKAYFDGALGSRGAWLLNEYADQPGYYGQNTMNVADLQQYADISKKHDLQFCVHAIGDKANRETLNLFQKNTSPQSNHRWRIEHAQHIDPEDQPRFGKLGVIASMQPIHCTSDAPFVATRLGLDRARNGSYVWRNLMNQKARLAIGTDVPVESLNPFENMYAAVSRKSRSIDAAFFSEQIFSRLEILRAYTSENAYAAFEEMFKGQLKSDYLADICILDTNLMTCKEEDIPLTSVITTILNGKVVYQKK